MNVGVAVGALGANVRKHGLGMAARAAYALVHAAEGIARPIMIELRNSSNRFPAQ